MEFYEKYDKTAEPTGVATEDIMADDSVGAAWLTVLCNLMVVKETDHCEFLFGCYLFMDSNSDLFCSWRSHNCLFQTYFHL